MLRRHWPILIQPHRWRRFNLTAAETKRSMIDNDHAISIPTLIARPCHRQFSWFTKMKSKYFLVRDVFRLVTSMGTPCWSQQYAGRMLYKFRNGTRVESLWLSCRASEPLSSWERRIFSLSHARDKTKKIFLYFFTELKTYHLYLNKYFCTISITVMVNFLSFLRPGVPKL